MKGQAGDFLILDKATGTYRESPEQIVRDDVEKHYWLHVGRTIVKDWRLYVMLLPTILVFLFWRYLPMYELLGSFKVSDQVKSVSEQYFAGFSYFKTLLTGTGTLTANADGVGSGVVELGNSLDGFNGLVTYKGGITRVSSLAFAATRPNALELGWGTLDYTGTGETIAGLTLNAGTIYSSVLRIENDLTLTSLGGVAGGLIKKGAGDLIFKGNGTFAFANFQRDYGRTSFDLPQGIRPTGEPYDSSLPSMLVSEGRLVIGTKGDDSDAPHVTSPTRPERNSGASASRRAVDVASRPGARRSRNACRAARSIAKPAGRPSIVTPMAGAWDWPKMVMRMLSP